MNGKKFKNRTFKPHYVQNTLLKHPTLSDLGQPTRIILNRRPNNIPSINVTEIEIKDTEEITTSSNIKADELETLSNIHQAEIVLNKPITYTKQDEQEYQMKMIDLLEQAAKEKFYFSEPARELLQELHAGGDWKLLDKFMEKYIE